LHAQNAHLRTRVSELEVINDLFRGRVGELEQAEHEARRATSVKDTEVEQHKAELEAANASIAELRKRVADLETAATPPRKRTRQAADLFVTDEDEES